MNILDGLNPPQLNFGSSITPNEEQVQKLITESMIAIQMKTLSVHDALQSLARSAIAIRTEGVGMNGKLPLEENHICFPTGHAMFEVFRFENTANGGKSSWGQHKCSRCGYEEDWQYDFV